MSCGRTKGESHITYEYVLAHCSVELSDFTNTILSTVYQVICPIMATTKKMCFVQLWQQQQQKMFLLALRYFDLKVGVSALSGVAQWTECWPINQKVTGLIPGQGTCLGCRPGPQLRVCKRQLVDVSLPLFLPSFPLSKNK